MLNNNFQIILFKFGLWLATGILICLVGVSGVFADTTDVGYISNNTQVLVGIPNSGAPITLNQNTSVNNSSVNAIWFNINYNFIKDKLYQFEISTPDAKLVNINTFGIEYNGGVCNFYGYSDADIGYPKIYFKCLQNVNYLSISLKNWDNNNIVNASNFKWSYTYLRILTDDEEIDFGPVISNQNQNTQDIINNQNQNNQNVINNNNQNTQDIINNQNQNTQDIIDNQNANTDKEIQSQKVCNTIIYDNNYNSNLYTKNAYLTSDGTTSSSDYFQVSPFISGFSKITRSYLYNNDNIDRYCFYDENRALISCSSTGLNINIPNNAYFFRFTTSLASYRPTYTIYICQNGNQAVSDTINDDNIIGATSEASNFFSSFTTNTFGLTSIITAPLNLIQSLTSSTCSQLHLPLPYLDNKYLDLPCMTSIYQTHFGAFFTMYQTITYGIIAYWVCVRIFNQVKDFKNPEHDEIEVVDL